MFRYRWFYIIFRNITESMAWRKRYIIFNLKYPLHRMREDTMAMDAARLDMVKARSLFKACFYQNIEN